MRTRYVRPVFPAVASRFECAGGTIVIEIVVATDGTVVDTKVLRSIPLLDQAALDAVRQWQFAPTVVDGVARPLLMTVPVTVVP